MIKKTGPKTWELRSKRTGKLLARGSKKKVEDAEERARIFKHLKGKKG